MFQIQFSRAEIFKRIIKVLDNTILSGATWHISPLDGVWVKELDASSSRTSYESLLMTVLKLDYQSINARESFGVITMSDIAEKTQIRLSISSMLKIISASQKDEQLTVSIPLQNPDSASFVFDNGSVTNGLQLSAVAEEDDEYAEPSKEYTISVAMSAKKFFEMCKELPHTKPTKAKGKWPTIELEVTPFGRQFILRGTNEEGVDEQQSIANEDVITVSSVDDKKKQKISTVIDIPVGVVFKHRYDASHLYQLAQARVLSDVVRIFLHTEQAALFEFNFLNHAGHMRYYLSPITEEGSK